MPKISLPAFMVLLSMTVFGQTTIAIQDFEVSPESPVMVYTSDGTVSGGTSTTPSDEAFHASQGMNGLIFNNGDFYLETEALNLSTYTNISLTFRLASLAESSNNGADGGDEVAVWVSTDGGSTYSEEIRINGNNNAKWSYASATGEVLEAYDGDNSPLEVSPESGGILTGEGLGTVTLTGLPDGINVKIKITASNDSENEVWAIDEVIITGDAISTELVGFEGTSSAISEPATNTAFSLPVLLSNYEGSQVDLNVSVTGGSAEVDDYQLNTTSLSFTSSGIQDISLNIFSDNDLAGETIEITITETTSTGINITPAIHTISIEDKDVPDLVINEFLADPDASNGDANGDGDLNISDDEFVEIVNFGPEAVDLSDWVLADGNADQHVFTEGTILGAYSALVVFAGGTPTGEFGGAIVQVSSSGSLNLNNSGDDILLKSPDGDVIFQVTYGSEGGSDESIALSPDLTGTFVAHSDADTEGETLYSPGSQSDGTAFFPDVVIWDGSESNSWDDADNWDGGEAPSSASDVVIPSGVSEPVVKSDAAVKDLYIASEVIITVESGASLAIFGDATGDGKLTVKRNSTGNAGYSIVGSPVIGVSVEDLGADYIYSYDEVSGAYVAGSGDMNVGSGFFVGYDAASPEISLTGTAVSGTQSTFVSAGGTGDGFNLVANPYAAPLSIEDFLANEQNSTALASGSIYLWDDGGTNEGGDRGGDYVVTNGLGAAGTDIVDLAGAGLKGTGPAENGYIGSFQGFFVKAASSTDVQFTASMQSTDVGANTDTNFYRKATSDEKQLLKLSISGNGLSNAILLGLVPDATFGKDFAYDAEKLSGNENISFYSMIEDERFAIQGLPIVRDEATEVTLGMDLAIAGEYELKVQDFSGFPEGIKVFLVDEASGKTFELVENVVVAFSTAAVSKDQRFKVVFAPSKTLALQNPLNNLKVLGSASELTIHFATDQPESINIYSLDGKIAFKDEISFIENRAVINPVLNANQIYILRIRDEAIKFIIQ